jgi:hypothetical protein
MEMLGAFECDHNNSLSQGLFYINADRGLYKVSLLLADNRLHQKTLFGSNIEGRIKQEVGLDVPQ